MFLVSKDFLAVLVLLLKGLAAQEAQVVLAARVVRVVRVVRVECLLVALRN